MAYALSQIFSSVRFDLLLPRLLYLWLTDWPRGPEVTWSRKCHFDFDWINATTDPIHNKNNKFLLLLHDGGGKYLKDTPIEIIPMVLALLRSTAKKECELNVLFGFVREWNMPLLYTSCAGPQLRRSKRIHKKMVMKYMG